MNDRNLALFFMCIEQLQSLDVNVTQFLYNISCILYLFAIQINLNILFLSKLLLKRTKSLKQCVSFTYFLSKGARYLQLVDILSDKVVYLSVALCHISLVSQPVQIML